MPIDNFSLIKPLLKFNGNKESSHDQNFYFLQVIQRKKDFTEGQHRLGRNNNNRLIKGYFIYNEQQLDDYKEEIVKLCTLFNARAGINLNRRNQKDVALKCLEMLAIAMRKDEYYGISKIYNSACGKEGSDDKTWIVDIDNRDEFDTLGYEMLEVLKEIEPVGDKVLAKIPSKSGYHLITKRFNREVFSRLYPHIEIHKNNPTNIFIP